jgi:ABC-type lipoprotein export system ATPase subunit
MQTYELTIASPVSTSFRCQRAADSLDIDSTKKSIHHFKVVADLSNDYQVGLIYGASGSGKTTLAKSIYGEDCFKVSVRPEVPIIDQLPKELSYDDCASLLAGIGLTSVPCWIRPVNTLSNGQRARAEAALAMSHTDSVILIDEWTSVVDRTVAKVMSHCIQKFARKFKKKVILLSCHNDVIEWLNPDWVIDCNTQQYTDRRLLRQTFTRTDHLSFDIKECPKQSWKYFSKYHYLSDRLPVGKIYTLGLYSGQNQIGFQCFTNYVPPVKGKPTIFHSNRTVIHPDYAGLGLGIILINKTSQYMVEKYGYRVMAKFSSTPIYRSMVKQKEWRLRDITRALKKHKQDDVNVAGHQRTKVKTYSFEYIGGNSEEGIQTTRGVRQQERI